MYKIMYKKSEGLSLNVVVIAAIALVVLIVLILIFSGRIQLFNKGVNECPAYAPRLEEESKTGFCPGGILPSKIIHDTENDKVVYCCKPTPVDKCAECPKDWDCDPDTGICKSPSGDYPLPDPNGPKYA